MKRIKRISVAVSGVGGGVGQSIIKALRHSNVNIVGMDSEILATGLYAVSKGYIIPTAKDPNYLKAVLKICLKEKCHFFFPGLDAELPILSKNVGKIKEIGTTVVVSNPKVIDISDDKLLTHKFLTKNNINSPETSTLVSYLEGKTTLKFPLVLKPRRGGARSKGVIFLEKKIDLGRVLLDKRLNLSNLVVQEFIKGDEFTCSAININGRHLGTIVMRRILRDGDTYKCFVEKNEAIENLIAKTVNILQPFGACNIQLRLRNNIPYVFEINARCSGTTAARAIAGFNEPKIIIEYLTKGKADLPSVRKVSFLRYWNELVVENEKIKSLKEKKSIINKTVKKL